MGAKDENSVVKQILDAMGDSAESLILTDAKTDKLEVIKKNPKLPDSFWDHFLQHDDYNSILSFYCSYAVYKPDQKKVLNAMDINKVKQTLKTQATTSVEYRVRKTYGVEWYRMKISRILNSDNKLDKFVIAYELITEDKKYEELIARTGDTILIVDNEGDDVRELCDRLETKFYCVICNTGSEAMDILEKRQETVEAIIVNTDMPDDEGYRFVEEVGESEAYNRIPVIAASSEGTQSDEARLIGYGAAHYVQKPYNVDIIVGYIRRILRMKLAYEESGSNERDSLTGLYNKKYFMKRATEIIKKNPEESYRIVVANIDNFKHIGEKYGQEMANNVLCHVARNINKYVKELVLACRLGGDIFVMLQRHHVQTREEGRQLVQDIVKDAPVPNLSIRYGFYFMRDDERLTVEMMCDRARVAASKIKGQYGQFCGIYEDDIYIQEDKRLAITSAMEESLKKEEFKIYLQPKHNTCSKKIGGAEALVRWTHPILGFMNPGEFIPIFEDNGFIIKLDEYVCHKVCQMLVEWDENGKEMMPVSINISRVDFAKTDFFDRFVELVDSYGLDHSLIHVELTETAFAANLETVLTNVNKLHEAGFVIELDDFGTGYSSLNILNRIYIDILKLDMSIIKNDNPESDRNILDFCMMLAKTLKVKSVAEGAETEAQVKRLAQVGCDYIQGYYFSKPLPIGEFEEYLKNNN